MYLPIIVVLFQTAHTMLWILYLLSNRQELIKEVRTRDQQHVKHIVKETMRLYPVAPFLTRILPKESILHGYKLEEGVSIYLVFLFFYIFIISI